MSFSKAPVLRFNDNNNGTPPPNKYTPPNGSKVKAPVPYTNQKIPRFLSATSQKSAEHSSSHSSIRNAYNLYGRSESVDSARDKNKSNKDIDRLSKLPSSFSATSGIPPISKKPTGSFIEASTTSISLPSTTRRTGSKAALPTDKQNKRVYETQFLTKRKKLNTLKKDLLDRQKSILDLYASMSELRDKVLESTGKDLGPLEELKLVDLGSLKTLLSNSNLAAGNEMHQGKKRQTEGAGEDLVPSPLDPSREFNNEFISNVGKKLQEIPELYKQTCQVLMVKTNATCEWLKTIKTSKKIDFEEEEIKQQLEQHINEGESLNKQLEETKNLQEKKIEEILLEIKTKFHIHEIMRSGDNKNHTDLQDRLEILVSESTEMAQKLKQVTEELENERDKNNNLKDRKSTADIQLKGARQRLRDMENKLSTDEIRIAQLLSQMKVLEGQLKMKETSFDHKAKELQKVNKATGEQVAKLEKQRNIHEQRINELKRELGQKEAEAVAVITDLQNKLNETKQKTEEADRMRMATEEEIEACRKRMEEVEEKGRQLAELAEKTKSIVVTGDESKHSEREVELWTELQSTRVLLKSAETQIQQLKEDKIKFMDTIQQAVQEDDGNLRDVCAKYGAELVQRNEQITQLQEQIKELISSVENSQKQNALLESKLQEYQDMISTQKDTSPDNVQLQVTELQQKHIDLQATMTEVLCQNEQLEQALTQKQLEVEQRDRVMREQSKVLKVRDELIGLLKGKEQRQDEQISSLQSTLDEREKNVDKVNKEIAAKAEEMQELYSTLESKQIQVIRLEKLVKQLEEQHERGQAQRTRHEARIAQLEHALQEKRNQRGSKFLFL